MDISFSIRVVNEDGEPVQGAMVSVIYDVTNQDDYTDEDGWVEFERPKPALGGSGIRGTIYINGEEVGSPWIADGDTFSYTLP